MWSPDCWCLGPRSAGDHGDGDHGDDDVDDDVDGDDSFHSPVSVEHLTLSSPCYTHRPHNQNLHAARLDKYVRTSRYIYICIFTSVLLQCKDVYPLIR